MLLVILYKKMIVTVRNLLQIFFYQIILEVGDCLYCLAKILKAIFDITRGNQE